MWKRVALASFVIASVAGCANPDRRAASSDPWCLTESPMRIVNDELADKIFILDPRLAERIVAYNERGERECGWQP